MDTFYEILFKLREGIRISADRNRYWQYKALGLKSGYKCLFGKGVVVERPWRVSLGARCVFERDVWIKISSKEGFVSIGDNTFIGRGSELDVAKKVTIGNGCLIAPGVFIVDHDHQRKGSLPIFEQGCDNKEIVIENNVWIGANSVITSGVRIASGAIVGAGAVVTKNVEANTMVAGIPAVPIKKSEGDSNELPGI